MHTRRTSAPSRLDELGAQLEFIDVAGRPRHMDRCPGRPRPGPMVRGRAADDRPRSGLHRLPLGRRAAAGGRRRRVRDELRQWASPGARRAQGPALRAPVPDPPPGLRPGPGPGAPSAGRPGPHRLHAGPRRSARLDPRDRGERGDHPANRRAAPISRSPSPPRHRPVNVEGSAGLQMRFGVQPDALVADIREFERVCREEEAPPGTLRSSTTSSPSPNPARRTSSTRSLDETARHERRRRTHRSRSCPSSVLEHFSAGAQLHAEDRPRQAGPPGDRLELEYFLQRTRPQRDGDAGGRRCARGTSYERRRRRGPRSSPARGPTVARGQRVRRGRTQFF